MAERNSAKNAESPALVGDLLFLVYGLEFFLIYVGTEATQKAHMIPSRRVSPSDSDFSYILFFQPSMA